MKFTIERAAALAAMGLVSGLTAKKTIPVLGHVMITADGGDILFRATNLDQEATVIAPGQSNVDGAYCLPAAQLGDIIRNAPEGAEISFAPNTEGTRITIKAGRSRFNLPFIPADDFPTFPGIDKASEFQIEADKFAGVLSQCAVAMSRDATRYILNGVHIKSDGKTLALVGTDGHRLIKCVLDIKTPKLAATIPSDMVREMIKALQGHGAQMAKVRVDASKVSLAIGSAVVTSKLIDGSFPDVERVIPEHGPVIANVDRDEFIKAIRRASSLSEGKVRGVKIEFKPGVAVLSSRGENADGQDEIDITFDGEAVVVGFNSALLSDVVGAVDCDVIEIAPADGHSPVSIKSAAAPWFTGVVMPLRV